MTKSITSNIDMKTYLDVVAARVEFFNSLLPWCFEHEEYYKHEKLQKAKFLGITEEDINNWIKEKEKEYDDIPF